MPSAVSESSVGLNLIAPEKSGNEIVQPICHSPRTVYLQCRTCEHLHALEVGCGSRFAWVCPACANRWKRRVRSRYQRGIMAMRSPKLVTLTLRKTGRLAERLLELWRLRKYLFWTLRKRGYSIASWCGVVEPPNHVHLVVDMEYIPQWEMSAIWQRVTGDSFIVSIEAINAGADPRKVTAYLTKYLTKVSEWPDLNLGLLKGFHLVGSYALPKSPPMLLSCDFCGFLEGWRLLSGDAYYAQLDFILAREAHPPPDWWISIPLEGGERVDMRVVYLKELDAQ